ncbi:hypothetical protein BKA63DRAFT_30213 [Paraphoma chrysanthemicola]|nr:hypothetical protein BKA63DRAFT_30213 [Paraphoma chrysanthemicola]
MRQRSERRRQRCYHSTLVHFSSLYTIALVLALGKDNNEYLYILGQCPSLNVLVPILEAFHVNHRFKSFIESLLNEAETLEHSSDTILAAVLSSWLIGCVSLARVESLIRQQLWYSESLDAVSLSKQAGKTKTLICGGMLLRSMTSRRLVMYPSQPIQAKLRRCRECSPSTVSQT